MSAIHLIPLLQRKRSKPPLRSQRSNAREVGSARGSVARQALPIERPTRRSLCTPRVRARRFFADAGDAGDRRGAGADGTFAIGSPPGVKAFSRSQSNAGYDADCGRSQGFACRPALRPVRQFAEALVVAKLPSPNPFARKCTQTRERSGDPSFAEDVEREDRLSRVKRRGLGQAVRSSCLISPSGL